MNRLMKGLRWTACARKPQLEDEFHKVHDVVKKTTGSEGNSI